MVGKQLFIQKQHCEQGGEDGNNIDVQPRPVRAYRGNAHHEKPLTKQ